MISKFRLRGGNAMQEKSTVLRRIVFMYAALATIWALTVSTAESQPPNTHALIHIRNESSARATVYYRWGDRPWQKYVIEQQRGAYFNWRYDGNSQSSPSFIVRLDVDTQGRACVEHVLSRGASPDDNSMNYGHHYVIKQLQGTDTRYIQPVSQKAAAKVTDKNCSFPAV
jgi:hypothetical protein